MNPITIVIPTLRPDEGHSTGKIAIITGHANATVIVSHDEKHQGFTKTVNNGIRRTPDGSDVCILNDDILAFQYGWLATLQRALYSHPRYGIAAPSGNSSTAPLCHGKRGQFGIQVVQQIPFWCALVKRDVINRIGLLDESFIHYASDNWYCRTAIQAKFKLIWVRDVWLKHRQHGSGLIEKWRTHDQAMLARKLSKAQRRV